MPGRTLALLLVSAATAAAQTPRPFPFFNRGDPKIQTLVFVRQPDLDLAAKRIGVLPFTVPDATRPGTPSFGDLLHQGLLAAGLNTRLLAVDGFSWDDPRLTEEERIGWAAGYARSRNLDLVVAGRVDYIVHRRAGGLVLKVTLRLIAAETAGVVFYASKKADWLRSYPPEDCFRALADSFLSELVPPAD